MCASFKKRTQKTCSSVTSNKSRRKEKRDVARVRKHDASIVAEEQKKNDDNDDFDASALIALVQAVTAFNIVPTAPEAKASTSSTEAKAVLRLNTILKKIGRG